MNRTVKILLVILVGVIISGGSFLAGSMIGTRQAMALNAAPAMGNLPFRGMNGPSAYQSSDDTSSAINPRQGKTRPGMNSERTGQPGAYMNPRTGNFLAHRPYTNFDGRNTMSTGSLFMGGGMMFLGFLFPLGFAILMVLGIIVLFRMVRNPNTNMVASTRVCAECGAGVQNGWKHCPQCGTEIK